MQNRLDCSVGDGDMRSNFAYAAVARYANMFVA
jgi:hypothetical protein